MLKEFLSVMAVLLVLQGTSFAAQIRFDESVLPYKDGYLIPNFGTETKVPAQGQANGYILYYDKNTKTLNDFIATDGNMVRPTGMAVYNDKLYICNKTNVLVYHLADLKKEPQKIKFADDDKELNDLVVSGDKLYVTVTDTNRVYEIDLVAENMTPHKWADIPGPNGIAAYNDTIYVVSIPADYATVTAENVVYVIKDKNNPVVEKFNYTPGLYDGVAVSNDGKTLYVSDWLTSSVKAIDTSTKKEQTVYQAKDLSPADFALDKNKLLIPDMMKHRVIVFNMENNSEQIIE